MAQREGFLYVDHRASPGFTDPEMARRMGGTVGSTLIEVATLTCAHCKIPRIKNPFRTRERHKCPKCNYHYICDYCAAEMTDADYVHKPFGALVDAKLERALKGG